MGYGRITYSRLRLGAIAGGLSELYYGYDGVLMEWLDVIKRREWIEKLCLVDI